MMLNLIGLLSGLHEYVLASTFYSVNECLQNAFHKPGTSISRIQTKP